MGLFMFTVGVLQIIAGVIWWAAAPTSIHEIVAAVLLCSGVSSLGLGAIIERLDKR